MIFEIIDPQYLKQLNENIEMLTVAFSSTTILRYLYADDLNRLVVRASYIDDGYVRVRDTSASIDILDMLREFSWTFYNLAESNKLLNNLSGALSSVGTDKLRTSVIDAIPESPFNLTKISGTTLTARDWSGDLAKLQNIDVLLSSRLGADVSSAPDSSPPSKGVMILGFDGTYVRRVKTTADGKLLTVLG